MEQAPPRLRYAAKPLSETSGTAERPSRQGPRRAPPRTPEAPAPRRAQSASSSRPRPAAEQAAIPAAAAAAPSPPAGHGRSRPGLHDAPGSGHLEAARLTSARAWPRHALSAVRTSPVSSRLFRFDRTFGQPPDTASMNFDPVLSISCVTVSLVTLPFPSMSKAQRE